MPSSPWASPLQGFENADPLPTGLNPDGKSLINPPATTKSSTYEQFPPPIDSSNNGFDFHIYYMPTNKDDADYAKALHERIRREFPELRIYRFWDRAVGGYPSNFSTRDQLTHRLLRSSSTLP